VEAAAALTDKSWSIYKARSDKQFFEGEAPVKIAAGLPAPQRLSWFADGTRLLVSFASRRRRAWESLAPPAVVDTVRGTQTPFVLPVLRDPSNAKAKPLMPRE
jgi:hypothetical protein